MIDERIAVIRDAAILFIFLHFWSRGGIKDKTRRKTEGNVLDHPLKPNISTKNRKVSIEPTYTSLMNIPIHIFSVIRNR